MWRTIVICAFVFASLTTAVDRSNFKTCSQSAFCRKNRELKGDDVVHELLLDTVKLNDAGTAFSAVIRNHNTNRDVALEIWGFEDRTFRIKLNEAKPERIRYEVNISIDSLPEAQPITFERGDSETWINLQDGIRVRLQAKPFQITIHEKETVLVTLNSRNLLLIDPMRVKPSFLPSGNNEKDQPANEAGVKKEEWHDETFKSHTDTKPFGENSVGLDVTFNGFDNVYGIPEHADSFRLRSTHDMDPYRLYNLDVFEYEVDSVMALYGSIPFMMAHSVSSTLGFFWNNAAETWIDVDYEGSDTRTHWFSETGVIDMFFFIGPSPSDVSRQFTGLVGRPFLPPFAMLGYHQSRWNYNDEADVAAVQASFDQHNIPLDTIWLDIEYADDKRYFTWDKTRFPHPKEMIANLTSKGRNMILISDTHIKKDDKYFVYAHMKNEGHFIKTKEGIDYEGWCWPGASYYPDFLNPKVQEYYAGLYSMDTFNVAWTWNDMNEPSVFNGPEITMSKDNLHFGGWEHREVHNMYGMTHLQSTFSGHLKRSNNQLRPFILARAFFAGSQRFAAVWTGDNMADWDHLRVSSPMVLSMGVAGMTFTGADVGGFFKNPDVQLLIRWYQAAAFHPFFRSHAHIETKRREPYLYDETHMSIMRDAVRLRYTYLPFWYTLFFEASQAGMPMMRPLWYAFPKDRQTFATDDAFLLGEALLVKPVTQKDATSVDVYFPGGATTRWYDVETLRSYSGGQTEHIDAPLNKIPVFQRSGSVIPRRLRARRSAILSIEDPLTLEVALDDRGTANGTVFLDDGATRDHLNGEYFYIRLEMQKNVIRSRVEHYATTYKTRVWLERVQIVGFRSKPNNVSVKDLTSGVESPLEFSYDSKLQLLTIRKPGVSMASEWDLTIKP